LSSLSLSLTPSTFYSSTGDFNIRELAHVGSMSKPIKRQQSGQSAEQQASRSFGTSYRSGQNALEIAEQSIARDCEDNDGLGEGQDVENALSRTTSHERAGLSQLSMAGNYRRPSWTSGAPRPFMASQQPERGVSLDQEREAAIREERSLLRDNNLLPRKHSRQSSSDNATGKNLKRYASVSAFSNSRRKSARMDEEEATGTDGELTDAHEATEATTLLNGDDNSSGDVKQKSSSSTLRP
jgi:MATE family multidrug resistance protein